MPTRCAGRKRCGRRTQTLVNTAEFGRGILGKGMGGDEVGGDGEVGWADIHAPKEFSRAARVLPWHEWPAWPAASSSPPVPSP